MSERCESLLMTTDAVGGVWTYSLALARELSSAGTAVTLAVLGPKPSEAQHKDASQIRNVTLLTCEEPLEWMDEPWRGVARSGEFLLDVAKTCRADLVHLNGYSHGALPFDCPKLVVAHSCVLSWWEAVKGEPAPARYARYRRAVATGLRHADELVAPTAAMLRAVQRHYGVTRGLVVPNGVGMPTGTNSHKEDIVLCAGRLWDEAKNLKVLAAAAAKTDTPIYVAGPAGRELDGVRALGNLSALELKTWFQRASIFASPALYEPFGLAALEAAVHGAALVLGDIESLREVWGGAAIYVSPRDDVALRRAIDLLARNPAFRDAFARRAERRARRYSLTKQFRLYANIYSRLVKQRAATTRRSYFPNAASPNQDGHAHSALLPLTRQRLESRQRTFSEGGGK